MRAGVRVGDLDKLCADGRRVGRRLKLVLQQAGVALFGVLPVLGAFGERLTDAQADEIVTEGGPGDLWPMYQIAQAILGVAFFPDSGEEKTKPAKKKTSPKPGASAKS